MPIVKMTKIIEKCIRDALSHNIPKSQPPLNIIILRYPCTAELVAYYNIMSKLSRSNLQNHIPGKFKHHGNNHSITALW